MTDAMNRILGKIAIWSAAFMVTIQFIIVLLRYVFSVNYIWMQESIMYAFSVMFLLSSGLAYRRNLHVRIDVLSAMLSNKSKAVIEMLGVVLVLFPMCFVIWYYSWEYVVQSWDILETSAETDGIPFVYGLKTLILIFVFQLLAQGVVQFGESYQNYKSQE